MNDGKRKYEFFGMLCKWSGLQSDDENDSAEGFKEAEYHSRQASSLCPFGGKVSGSSVRCGAQNFLNMFKDAEKRGTVVIGLRNIMSMQEMEEKLKEHGIA